MALCLGGAARADKPPAFAPVAPPPALVGAAAAALQGSAAAPAATATATPAVASATPPAPVVVADRSPAQAANTSVANEAGVRSTVVEDGGARIEELSVRGAVRSIHVAPKGVGAGMAYEVLPSVGPGGPRDQASGPTSPRSNAGQRVWSLFSF
jgi:hypothetical protein